jgi:predicted kinase
VLVLELVRTGTPCVLEIGLTERAAREAFYERIARAGLKLALHVVEAPAHVRWQRVEARNRERGATFAGGDARDVRLRRGHVGAAR